MHILCRKKVLSILLASTLLLGTSVNSVYAKKRKLISSVEFESYDHFLLSGEVRLPKIASIKNKVPVVILLHPLGKDKNDWGNIPQFFNDKNLAVFMYDLRGHGSSHNFVVSEDSLLEEQNKPKYWFRFAEKNYADLPKDIIESVKFLKENYPEIDTTKVAIIGCDISANATIIASVKLQKIIETIVLISPTMEFKGLFTPIELVALGDKPVLILNNRNDLHSYNDSKELVKYAQGVIKNISFDKGGSGLNIVKNNPIAKDVLDRWFDRYLKYVPKPKPKPEIKLSKEEMLVNDKIPPDVPYKPTDEFDQINEKKTL